MRIVNFCLMTGLAFGLPLAAFAQQNLARANPADIRYCNALAKSYSSLFPAQEGMTAAEVTTMSRCDTDPQATIPVLEKKLGDKKIELPHDNRVAEPPGATGNTQ